MITYTNCMATVKWAVEKGKGREGKERERKGRKQGGKVK